MLLLLLHRTDAVYLEIIKVRSSVTQLVFFIRVWLIFLIEKLIESEITFFLSHWFCVKSSCRLRKSHYTDFLLKPMISKVFKWNNWPLTTTLYYNDWICDNETGVRGRLEMTNRLELKLRNCEFTISCFRLFHYRTNQCEVLISAMLTCYLRLLLFGLHSFEQPFLLQHSWVEKGRRKLSRS